jgi:hypothetical protein
MDYILRDALTTGVKYGAYDAEWLLNSLCIGKEPGLAGTANERQWRLCLDERRGLYSAEQFVIARMHMSLQVYFHRATRGWEAHLLCLFGIAVNLAKRSRLPKQTPEVVARFFERGGDVTHQDFLLLMRRLLCAHSRSGHGPDARSTRSLRCWHPLSYKGEKSLNAGNWSHWGFRKPPGLNANFPNMVKRRTLGTRRNTF